LTLPGLEQEVSKVITYVGERKEITLSDVHALCSAQKSATFWQLAETMVWREAPAKTEELLDLSSLLPLLAQLRTQLQQGMTLAVLLEKNAPHSEIAHYLPTVKPSALDKLIPVARARRAYFFKRALDILFDVELMAKNSSFEPALLLDLFLTKITLLKRRHDSLPLPQSSR
jgi:DNA polymerase-3 subunit delta